MAPVLAAVFTWIGILIVGVAVLGAGMTLVVWLCDHWGD